MAKLQVGINDLNTVSPEIAKEWHPTLNGAIKPCDLIDKTSIDVWWSCLIGHSYEQVLCNKSMGQGCAW